MKNDPFGNLTDRGAAPADRELNSEGICCTCGFRESCLAYKNSRISARVILSCEEFDDRAANVAEKKQKQMQLKKGADNKGADRVKASSARGLCLNCGDAGICQFAGFGNEVVFCEQHSSNLDNERQSLRSHKTFADLPGFGVRNLISGWDA